MAQRVRVELVDDLDGSAGPTVETITFGLDGKSYEVDLSKKNAQKLRSSLAGYLEVARAANNGTRPKPKAKKGPQPREIRQWAAENGIEVPSQGRIPRAVEEQYLAAH